MFTLMFLVVLTSLTLTVYMTSESDVFERSPRSYLKFWSIGSLIIILIGTFINILALFPDKVENEGYTTIVSLERGSNVEGSFVLGFGSIGESTVYYGYHSNGKNNYELVQFYLYRGGIKLTITEDNSEVPRYSIKTVCKIENRYFFHILFGLDTYRCDPKRTLYVPEGTIQKNFNG